jgi:drug/metabolite transporter (DMT)-like permease
VAAPLSARLLLLLVTPPVLWAGNSVVGRMVVGHLPPLGLNALRWLLAAAILALFGWPALATPAARDAIRARWRHLAALGLFGVGAYNALQYLALTTTTPTSATLIAASAPAWMIAIGLIVHGERPLWRQVVGALLSLAGAMTVVAHGDLGMLRQVRFVAGDLLMLVATLSWSVYSWMLARPPAAMRAPQRPPWNWAGFLLVQTLFGLVWAGGAGIAEQWVRPQNFEWSAWTAAALLFVAVGPSILAYRCWGLAVTEAGPAVAAVFVNLTPLFAALLSMALLGDAPQAYHAVAFGLILAGIAVTSRR